MALTWAITVLALVTSGVIALRDPSRDAAARLQASRAGLAPARGDLSESDKYEYREIIIQGQRFPLRIMGPGLTNETYNVRMTMFSDPKLQLWNEVPSDNMHSISAKRYADMTAAIRNSPTSEKDQARARKLMEKAVMHSKQLALKREEAEAES
mmetsp:Transcript_50486/g.135032  ORF Transcript_50486/g.135032 Transcript_50486/m.135032 type:complete len:154 (-) Transcript_50486:157-618(-)